MTRLTKKKQGEEEAPSNLFLPTTGYREAHFSFHHDVAGVPVPLVGCCLAT